MIYYIGFLPDKNFQAYYREVIAEICDELELSDLKNKERIAHITLKSPFERKSEKDIVRTIDDFVQDQESSNLIVKGVGQFNNEILYFGVQPNSELKEATRNLLYKLKLLGDVPFDKTWDTENKTFHITLGKRSEMEGKFDDVYSYVRKAGFPEKRIKFDNLTIFKKDCGKTTAFSSHTFHK